MKKVSLLLIITLFLVPSVTNAASYQGQWAQISEANWDIFQSNNYEF